MSTEPSPQPDEARQTHKFQAEVNQVLHLVIHSLYSHKEIFLRELVSNASDALDKLRFRAITEPESSLGEDAALEIRIWADREQGTLTIEDNGVGMTADELTENLGTIARSGSRAFLAALQESGKSPKEVGLIGQFGVGFYSAYLVADHVEVVSRPAGANTQAWRWSSDAKETFSLEPAERAGRGTQVILHLKDDQKQFLDEWQLRDLVQRYSDYVSHPIRLRKAPDPKAGAEPTALPEYDTINQASALWRRPKGEITDAQYDELYQHLTHDWEKPVARTHFRTEGSQEFVGLLFVPGQRPMMDFDTSRRRGVRLFVRRVFVMDDCEELLPEWLRFVRGVVDSDDLPLNVSREVLQDSAIVRGIRKHVVKKTLDMLDELARDKPADYEKFWKAFGPVFKAGLHLDGEQRDRIAQLIRYRSSASPATASQASASEGPGAQLVSLKEYVGRMKEGQEAIYYVLGDSEAVLAGSPHLEALARRGYEVLYGTDPVDEWAIEALREFEGKKLVSAMRAELSLGGSDEEKQERDAGRSAVQPLLDRMRAVLQESVQEVRASERLTDSPCCLVVPEGAPHAAVERMLRSHGHRVPAAKRILEVNPGHPLIAALQQALDQRGGADSQVTEWIELLHDQALLTEGSAIADPHRFARRMTSMMTQVLAGSPPPAQDQDKAKDQDQDQGQG